jgi:hypothetical protein
LRTAARTRGFHICKLQFRQKHATIPIGNAIKNAAPMPQAIRERRLAHLNVIPMIAEIKVPIDDLSIRSGPSNLKGEEF